MEKIKKILAPTDMSDSSRAGVRYALELATTLGAEVTVYHVVSSDELMSQSGQSKNLKPRHSTERVHPLSFIIEKYEIALARFLGKNFKEIIPRVNIRERVEMGIPDTNIVERAKAEGADIIIISTHGRTGLSHVLLGSVTEKVVRNAPCPVISVRPNDHREATEKHAATG